MRWNMMGLTRVVQAQPMAKPETAKELPFVRAEVGKISVGSGKVHGIRRSWRVR